MTENDQGRLFLQRARHHVNPDGSERVEWHTHGLDVEIEFRDGHTRLYAYAVDDTASVELHESAEEIIGPVDE
jgi:YD repeat-containing protein